MKPYHLSPSACRLYSMEIPAEVLGQRGFEVLAFSAGLTLTLALQ